MQRKVNRKTLKNTIEILLKLIQRKNTLHTEGCELRTVSALKVEKMILEVYQKKRGHMVHKGKKDIISFSPTMLWDGCLYDTQETCVNKQFLSNSCS